MAAQLWMLRHGEAVPHDSKPDHDRELTPRGRGQSETAGRALAALTLLDAHDGNILVVGHEPSFSHVVYDFTGGRVDFKKGGVAALEARRTSGELLVMLR